MKFAIEEVEMFKTKDGKLFENLDKAKVYTQNKIGESLEAILKDYETKDVSFRAYKLIIHLLDTGKMEQIYQTLHYWYK